MQIRCARMQHGTLRRCEIILLLRALCDVLLPRRHNLPVGGHVLQKHAPARLGQVARAQGLIVNCSGERLHNFILFAKN